MSNPLTHNFVAPETPPGDSPGQPAVPPAGRATTLEARPNLENRCRQISAQLVEKLDLGALAAMNPDELRKDLRQVVEHLVDQHDRAISADEREALVARVLDEAFGYGPLDGLMRDPDVDEICVNGPSHVFCRRRDSGTGLSPHSAQFRDREHLLQVVERLTSRPALGDAPLPTAFHKVVADGWLLNVVAGAWAFDGPFLRLKRLARPEVCIGDLLPAADAKRLAESIAAGSSVLVCGPANSGKTALANTLAGMIEPHSRIATVEQGAGLKLQQTHVVRLLVATAGETAYEADAGELVAAARLLRPDWLVVDELCPASARGAVDAYLADGLRVIATVRSRSPATVIPWLEGMLLSASSGMPPAQVRRELAESLDVIVHLAPPANGRLQLAGLFKAKRKGDDVELVPLPAAQ